MDLHSVDESKLFDAKSPAHYWSGVFCFHHPTVLLLLNSEHVTPLLSLPESPEETAYLGLFINEVEACCRRPIPTEWILGAMVIGKRYRIISKSNDLSAVLDRALQVRNYSRHRRTFPVKST